MLLALTAPQVVILTTCGALSDNKAGIKITLELPFSDRIDVNGMLWSYISLLKPIKIILKDIIQDRVPRLWWSTSLEIHCLHISLVLRSPSDNLLLKIADNAGEIFNWNQFHVFIWCLMIITMGLNCNETTYVSNLHDTTLKCEKIRFNFNRICPMTKYCIEYSNERNRTSLRHWAYKMHLSFYHHKSAMGGIT